MAAGKSVASELVYPLERAAWLLNRCVFRPLADAFTRPSLAAENRRLADEVARLRMLLDDQSRLRGENARFRTMLDFAARRPEEWIAAPVLSRGGTTGAADLIRLGKGSLAGIAVGAAVAVPAGLVGRVAAVSPHTADVRLLTDPELRVSCRIDRDVPGASERVATYGILSGHRITRLKRDLTFPPRAAITTSGLGGVYPPGLAVGRLADGAHEDASRLEQEGEVIPAVDFTALEDVFVRREN